MKIPRTAAGSEGTPAELSSERVAQPDADGTNGTPAPEPTPPADPDVALEHPSEGGSYVRQPDGSLEKQEV